MSPLELYKKLPRKNCGKCAQKACMPFALAVISGDADAGECPCLSEEGAEEIRGSLSRSAQPDWREELILKLREEVGKIHFEEIAADLGGTLRGDSLILNCLGREFSITPRGEISTRGHLTPWMKILLLHYIRTSGKGNLTGKWISYGEMKCGMVKASAFQREAEDPLRELFDRDTARVAAVMEKLGAGRRDDFPTGHAWLLFLLPKMPVVILYWPPEEEFPSKVKVLFDSTADRFLDVESIIFLVEGLIKNIENNLFLDKE
ncbi:MAG: DUF3786 domain-containing protein [Alphaproteobacteria bacterium]|uniref:DUF3786 domain-containing protein n=1 Tax=Candidatus Nitrobium versatile TaxID=2884831 RepID=A0A953JAZ7_9BACT|nr:DUF3786 domain-containing protein [Candidatus Nitrobium versatile]